jgi:hypothetical protein
MRIRTYVKKVLGKIAPNSFYVWINSSYALGYFINLRHPKSFNEKMNWLKVHDHNPEYTKMADKYDAKTIVRNLAGDKYVVPCYGVWDSPDDICLDSLPNEFVLKCTHDCTSVIICRDKSNFDFTGAKEILRKNLGRSYYEGLREWPYKNIKPRIIADMFLDDGREGELQDYKFWCFNGEPKIMYFTNKGKTGKCYENFYDMDFKPLNIDHGFPRRVPEYDKPAEFEEMKEIATKLSKGMPFVRIDLFDIKGHVYFGEFTFYDWGAGHPFNPRETDYKIGELMKLPID